MVRLRPLVGSINEPLNVPWVLGAYKDGTFGGNHVFTEVIVFNRYLDDAEVLAVEAYLKARYDHYA